MLEAVRSVLERKRSHAIDASAIRRWAIAVYWPHPPHARFIEGHSPLVPEEFNPFAWSVDTGLGAPPQADVAFDDPARIEKLLRIPPPRLQHQVHGGVSVVYGVPMAVGDVIESEVRLVGYQQRTGRLGEVLITTTSDSWVNQRAELVRRATLEVVRY